MAEKTDYQKIALDIMAVLQKYHNLLIWIKGSPDPDVLASSFALKTLCEASGINALVYSPMEVSLEQNKIFVEKLGIPVVFKKAPALQQFDAYAVLDHQSPVIDEVSEQLPCALHIDHHPRAESTVKPELTIITEAGSTSTILTHVLKVLIPDIAPDIMRPLSTALIIGLRTDTDEMRHAGREDNQALMYLTPLADAALLADISSMPYSEETITTITKAMINREQHRDVLICGVGYMAEDFRDSIAITADFMLSREEVKTVVVFAIIRKKDGGMYLDASLRTRQKLFDLNHFIKSITENGGARRFKGAFQINLDYFSHYPDERQFWEVTRLATIEQIKYHRDQLPMVEIRGFFNRLRDGLHDLIHH